MTDDVLLLDQSGPGGEDWRPWFEQIHATNAAGGRLYPQVGSRCFGVLMGHSSRLNPWRHRPAQARDARPHPRPEALAHRADRSTTLRRGSFEVLFPLGAELDYEPAPEDSVSARARQEGRDAWAVAYDLCLQAEAREFLMQPLLNCGSGSYEGLQALLTDPTPCRGLGDGGTHVGLVCDASIRPACWATGPGPPLAARRPAGRGQPAGAAHDRLSLHLDAGPAGRRRRRDHRRPARPARP